MTAYKNVRNQSCPFASSYPSSPLNKTFFFVANIYLSHYLPKCRRSCQLKIVVIDPTLTACRLSTAE